MHTLFGQISVKGLTLGRQLGPSPGRALWETSAAFRACAGSSAVQVAAENDRPLGCSRYSRSMPPASASLLVTRQQSKLLPQREPSVV